MFNNIEYMTLLRGAIGLGVFLLAIVCIIPIMNYLGFSEFNFRNYVGAFIAVGAALIGYGVDGHIRVLNIKKVLSYDIESILDILVITKMECDWRRVRFDGIPGGWAMPPRKSDYFAAYNAVINNLSMMEKDNTKNAMAFYNKLKAARDAAKLLPVTEKPDDKAKLYSTYVITFMIESITGAINFLKNTQILSPDKIEGYESELRNWEI